MATNHVDFIEGKVDGKDSKFSIPDILQSISYPIGAEKTLATYGKDLKELYILFISFPGWTPVQREGHLKKFKDEIIDAFTTIDMSYIDNLNLDAIITHDDGRSVAYHTPDFINTRDAVAKQLGIELRQVA